MRASELKHMTWDWSSKVANHIIPHHIFDNLLTINRTIKECSDRLSKDGLGGISYADQSSKISTLCENIGYLNAYAIELPSELAQQIDDPLFKAFNQKTGATELLSRIHLSDFSTKNTLGIKGVYVSGSLWLMSEEIESVKSEIGFEDFFGLKGVDSPYFKNVSCVKGFAELFEADYNYIKAHGGFAEGSSITDLDSYLTAVLKSGEFDHKTDQPFLNFLSGLLDITIVKPLIEAFTGYDMITGEDLTDLERGLKVVFAVVDAATLGQAIAATQALKLSGKLTAKEFSSVLLKTIGLELGSNAAGYTAGYISNELGLPLPITLALAGGAGIAVSKLGGKYLFKTADGLSVAWEPPAGTKPEALQVLDDAAAGRGLDEALEGALKSNDAAVKQIQKDIIDAVENGTIKLDNTMQKGNYGEIKADTMLENKFFQNQDLERLSVNRVTDINSSTHQGIDGVYYNPGPPPKYVVSEVKYGSSKLSTLSDGTKQMSNKWIDERLLDAIGEDAYNQYLIDKAVYPDCRTDVLIHVNTDYTVDAPKILINGSIAK